MYRSRYGFAAGVIPWVFIVGLSIPTQAQERNAIEVLHSLPLDSLTGTVKVYRSHGHTDRAQRLQVWYTGALAFYEERLAQDFASRRSWRY